jgi:glutamyl/glutaminyl-tRNA synthetase
VLTRFAPAPTGALHLGHVANAIYVWGLARRHGAQVLLRIEDHDRQRSRPAFEAALLDDLDWLGFAPEVFPTASFRQGACAARQSDRAAIYHRAAGRLRAAGLVYGCMCSRQRGRGDAAGAEGPVNTVYPGTCRNRHVGIEDGVAWRVRVSSGEEPVDDLLLPRAIQDPARTFGDVVIRDRLGNWTYQFTVAVDDFLQGIDFVVRGRDLWPSTGLQVQLARTIGRDTPLRFAHHPLIMKSATHKLSKSDGDTGIAALRAAGLAPEEVIGRAAHAVGLMASPEPIAAGEIQRLF